MEIGLSYCGEPDAFYGWDVETQERVLGWWRAKHTPAPAPASKRGKSVAEGDAAALAFWGLE
jgi:hypothetical protein